MRVALRLALALLILVSLALLGLWQWRPGMAAYQAHIVAPGATVPGDLTATWLGVTALLLRDGDHAILIDPFFTRPPGLLPMLLDRQIAPDEALIRDWLERLGITRLDAVLVSHSHFDHAMDAGVVARLSGARLIGSASTAQIGRGAGLPEERLQVAEPGQILQAGSFRIRFITSRHAGATGGHPTGEITSALVPPARYLDYRLGGTFSIVVEHPQARMLHHGSAGYEPGALANVQADVVFLGVALIEDLEAYLRETVDAVGARSIVPTHWDDFTRSLDQPLQPFPVIVRLDRFFAAALRPRPAVAIRSLSLGDAVPVRVLMPDA